MDWLERTKRLIGQESVDALKSSHVAVFGLGGVGGAAAWALARSGVGAMTLIDCDRVETSNLNRQMIATLETIGMPKIQAAEKMLLSINKDLRLTLFDVRADETNVEALCGGATFVADCIDDVQAKVSLIAHCKERQIPIISSMGTGNRLDPSRFQVTDISKTRDDGLARAVRSRLRKLQIHSLPVVYSDEIPHKMVADASGRVTPASIAFVPPSAGFVLAGEIVRRIIEERET